MEPLRFVLALAIVSGLILVLGWLFRRLVMGGALSNNLLFSMKKASPAHTRIELAESRIVDAKRRVVILHVGGRGYLLLLTRDGDMLLDRWELPEAEKNDKNTRKSRKNHVKITDEPSLTAEIGSRTGGKSRKIMPIAGGKDKNI